jgi:hypothetical protein
MVIMMAIAFVLAVFAADVMTVHPMIPVGHVAGDPNHLVITVPIAWAMAVIRPVADLDINADCSNSGRNENARHQNGGEQKFAFNHPPTDHAPIVLANTVLVARDTL